MLENLLTSNLLRISPEFLIDQNKFLPFLSYTIVQYLMTWFLIAVRQEVKIIDNSVVVQALELTINVTDRAVYEF